MIRKSATAAVADVLAHSFELASLEFTVFREQFEHDTAGSKAG